MFDVTSRDSSLNELDLFQIDVIVLYIDNQGIDFRKSLDDLCKSLVLSKSIFWVVLVPKLVELEEIAQTKAAQRSGK